MTGLDICVPTIRHATQETQRHVHCSGIRFIVWKGCIHHHQQKCRGECMFAVQITIRCWICQ